MKKLLLTSPGFAGEVEMIYGTDKMLMLIDMRAAELSERQIKYMTSTAPVIYVDLLSFKAAFGSDTLSVIEGDYKVIFDMFWTEYNVKRNRDRCEKIWDKMSEVKRVQAFAGLKAYNRHLALNSWKTKADPESYLRKEFWLNDWK
jgi:hypothetical protein